MTELEKKAEEYASNNCGYSPLQDYFFGECAKHSYIEGYKQGQLSRNSEQLKKENEELKKKLYNNDRNVFAELNDETAQSNAMLLEEIEDLKLQIEKMKCCGNCKHHKVSCLLDEPCEGYWNNWELAE